MIFINRKQVSNLTSPHLPVTEHKTQTALPNCTTGWCQRIIFGLHRDTGFRRGMTVSITSTENTTATNAQISKQLKIL